jgi:NADH:ubiquinone oxidoreductase subunit C
MSSRLMLLLQSYHCSHDAACVISLRLSFEQLIDLSGIDYSEFAGREERRFAVTCSFEYH